MKSTPKAIWKNRHLPLDPGQQRFSWAARPRRARDCRGPGKSAPTPPLDASSHWIGGLVLLGKSTGNHRFLTMNYGGVIGFSPVFSLQPSHWSKYPGFHSHGGKPQWLDGLRLENPVSWMKRGTPNWGNLLICGFIPYETGLKHGFLGILGSSYHPSMIKVAWNPVAKSWAESPTGWRWNPQNHGNFIHRPVKTAGICQTLRRLPASRHASEELSQAISFPWIWDTEDTTIYHFWCRTHRKQPRYQPKTALIWCFPQQCPKLHPNQRCFPQFSGISLVLWHRFSDS